jgi:DNA mismatch repair protein MutS2
MGASDYRALLFAAELGGVPELDLHGMDRFQAEQEVDAFLYDSAHMGERVVAVIHGRGTGVLREVVHRILSRHETVEHFEDALSAGSILGATYAVLKQ